MVRLKSKIGILHKIMILNWSSFNYSQSQFFTCVIHWFIVCYFCHLCSWEKLKQKTISSHLACENSNSVFLNLWNFTFSGPTGAVPSNDDYCAKNTDHTMCKYSVSNFCDWLWFDYGLTMDWRWTDYGLTMDW